ncbi:hypothetical protein MNBD_PLANCTO02-327, partial [hydrothermal vent metagenome]
MFWAVFFAQKLFKSTLMDLVSKNRKEIIMSIIKE